MGTENQAVDPGMVPQVTLNTGYKVPCIGMGTFGSDRFSSEEYRRRVAGANPQGYRDV